MISLMFGIGTIVIALVLILMAAIPMSFDEARFKSGKEVLTALIGVFGTILGFYFGSLADGTPGNPNVAALRTLGATLGPGSVDLSGTRVTDNDLRFLRSLPQTETLYLDNTQITDKGLAYLHELKNLNHLSLVGTSVSPTAIEKLWDSLTNLKTVIGPDSTTLSRPTSSSKTNGTSAKKPAQSPRAGGTNSPPAPRALQ